MGDINYSSLFNALSAEMRRADMVCGSFPRLRKTESYIIELIEYCNAQSIWLWDSKDHLMMYHPRSNRNEILEYLKIQGMNCGSLFYTGIWFMLNEKSRIFEVEEEQEDEMRVWNTLSNERYGVKAMKGVIMYKTDGSKDVVLST